MNMDAFHRSFLRAVVALCVAAMPAIRADAAMLTANNSSANMPVLSKNFPIPMSFSDAINGTTLFTLISGPAQGTLAYNNPTSGIVSVTAGVPISPYQYGRNWYYTSTNPIPGSDSFIWLCSDGPFTSALATVSITVTTNTAPVATPGTVSVAVNSSRKYVSLTGSHPDSYQPMMYRVVSLPSNGTLEGYTAAVTAGVWMASAYCYYTSGSTTGTDSFVWQSTDGIATSETSTVTLNIVSNSAPVASVSAYTVPLGAMRYSFFLSYAHADSLQPRYYSLTTAPTNGILESRTGTSYVSVVTGEWGTNGGNSSWYYTPSGTSTGVDSFTWQISDGMATSSAALMAITITTNRVPIGNAQTLTVLRNSGRKSVFLSSSYSHADSYQPMTFLLTASPSGGAVEYYDSSLTNYVPVPVATPVTAAIWYYTPNSNYTGSDSILWRVSDGISTSATTAVSIGVVSNSAPVARDMRLYCTPNGELVFAAGYTHADADQSCTATIVSNAGHGVATAVGATLVYVAQSGFKGNDMFTYKVSDGQADSATATVAIQIRAPGEPAGGLVDIVVNDLLYTVLSNEVQRLKADLTNEGYTAIITPVSSGTSAAAVWTHLNSIYQTNKWLVGALFVGDIAKMAPGGIISDGYYWNMQTFQTSAEAVGAHDIWVGRFTIAASEYGTEADLIRYALDANHYYRTGQSRLPNTAYVHVGSDWGGDAQAATEVSRAKQVWTNAYVDSNADGAFNGVNGSELICEVSHGDQNSYSAGMSKAGAHAGLVQSRAMFCTSCSSGYPNGVVNHQLFSRGGGNLFSVGGSVTIAGGLYSLFADGGYPLPAGQRAAFRALLAEGDMWGMAMVQFFPFAESDYYSQASCTMIYGDLSIRPLVTPPNAMPSVVSFTKDCATVYVGQPVTFTIAVSDPDGTTGEKSTNVLYRHQVEWFMAGYNYGRNNPTYTTNDYQNAGWTNVTHTFSAAGTYTVRAEVMDEWRARSYQEMTVTVQQPLVTCTVTVPTNGAVVIEGTNLTITAEATVTYGSVSNVEFYLDGLKIATALNSPYSCVWTNAVKGAHVLTAKGTDGAGNVGNSMAVSLSVLPIATCTITAPANCAALLAGTDLTITATAAVWTGTVSKVEFFYDGVKIGEDLSAPYACVWSNVPVGVYALTARATQSDGRTGDAAAVYVNATASGSWDGVSATGGTVTNYTLNGINYRVHIFAGSGTLTLTSGGTIEYLVVAGGGSGGRVNNSGNHAGGGGAGGLFAGTTNVDAQSYTITVGAGGAGRTTDGETGAKGGSSSIGSLVVTTGGGGGTSYGGTTTDKNGGSGGGASAWGGGKGTGIAGPPRQGYDGGADDGANGNGAGGGGAGGIGGNSTTGVGGNGGPGVTNSITGTATVYAGGGGGPGATTQGAGGSGIGGNGMQTGSGTTINGKDGTGSGGGGVGNGTSGKGGDGIVIVRYVVGGYEAWRQTQFDSTSLTNSAISGATADPDHDGLNNEQEYWAGTDPNSAASCLVIYALTNNPALPGEFVVSWQSVTGKTYSVLAATNLVTGFIDLTNGLPATPTVNVYTDTVNGVGQKFYRVNVE